MLSHPGRVTSKVLAGKQEKTSQGRRHVTVTAAITIIVSPASLDHRHAHTLGRNKLCDQVVHMIHHLVHQGALDCSRHGGYHGIKIKVSVGVKKVAEDA